LVDLSVKRIKYSEIISNYFDPERDSNKFTKKIYGLSATCNFYRHLALTGDYY
jgi:hypothetical protein